MNPSKQVSIDELKAFNASWVSLNETGKELNRLVETIESSTHMNGQIGQEGFGTLARSVATGVVIGVAKVVAAYAVILTILGAILAIYIHFFDNIKQALALFKKYSETILQNLSSVDPVKFSDLKISGYTHTRFLEVGKSLIMLGKFIDTSVVNIDKKEIIWPTQIFPSHVVSIENNDLELLDFDNNPGWTKATVGKLDWTTEKLHSVIDITKGVLATSARFNGETWNHLDQLGDKLKADQKRLQSTVSDEEKQKLASQLMITKKNLVNLRNAIHVYMYFAIHFTGTFFSLCKKAEKAAK